MKLEWSDEAIADLDRFVVFLNREHPSLASIVATEIIDKVQVLSAHPQLGRPIAGRDEYRQMVLQVLGAGYVFQYRSMVNVLSCYAFFTRARDGGEVVPQTNYAISG